MFKRAKSLRFIFGNGRQNERSSMSARISEEDKSNEKVEIGRRHSFHQVARDRRSHRGRFQNNSAVHKSNLISLAEYLKLPTDMVGNYKISISDGRFVLVVTRPNPYTKDKNDAVDVGSQSLFISTCIYTCTSDVQSTSVIKKAEEINRLSVTNGDSFEGYKLALYSGSSSSNHYNKAGQIPPQQLNSHLFPIKINLYFCRHLGDAMATHSDNEAFLATIKEFVKVALNVQTQLESVDEGRLGMTPRPNIPNDPAVRYVSHTEFLASPPSVVVRFMSEAVCATTQDEIVDTTLESPSAPIQQAFAESPTIYKQKESSRSDASEKHTVPSPVLSRGRGMAQTTIPEHRTQSVPNESTRTYLTTTRKSYRTKTMVSQFSSPEEFRVFELYAQQKSKKKVTNYDHRNIRRQSSATNTAMRRVNSIVTPKSRPPKRATSLPAMAVRGGHSNASIQLTVQQPPGPPTLSHWNKTPLISNKAKIGHRSKQNQGIATPVVLKKAPPSKKDSFLLSRSTGSSRNLLAKGKEIPSVPIKKRVQMDMGILPGKNDSERHLRYSSIEIGGSTRVSV